MHTDSKIHDLLNTLDGRGSDAEWSAVELLVEMTGDCLPGLLLQTFRRSTRSGQRTSCVYHATRYARNSADAVSLGREAIFDKSRPVRYRGCLLLAYAQDKDTIDDLKNALLVVPGNSHDDIHAAMDAIERGNHNYFVDREHSGMVTLRID